MVDFSIPKLDREELVRRADRIKPLMKDGEDLRWIKEPQCLSSVSYIWDAKLKDKAKGLQPVTTIKTLHSYGAPSLFKSSVEEVLSQIPEHLVDDIDAFCLRAPSTSSDLNKFKDELNAGFHVAFVTLYKRSKKENKKKTGWKKIWDGLIG